MKYLLGPCDSFQLEPFEFPWAWDMSRECEANTWAPEEIPVASDIADYKSPAIDPAHKHLFEAVMSQLTTFDIQRGDDAAETMLGLFEPAEIKHFLKRLVWEEALHTRSYRYIIENLGIPLEIYDRWQTVPSMRARIEWAQEFNDDLRLILVSKWATNSNPNFTLEQKRVILDALIFWFLIFEGIWFWLNLGGPIQSLARLGKFRGAAEQFSYILRDEQQHVRFGVHLIGAFIQQYPEVWDRAQKERVIAMFYKGIELETAYAIYCHSAGPVLGYSVMDHVDTAKFFANLRAKSLGMPDIFPSAKHRFPWMSETTELKKESNFFEKRVTEYQTGGSLKWD